MIEIRSLNELKSLELKIMKQVHSICECNGIRYYLSYGTLLGAVRHKGFIPWDDDIDIYMKRYDYERFLSLFNKNAEEYAQLGVELVNSKTQRYYGRPISKVIDNTTLLIETEYKTDDPIGVFIDVWPLDGTPNNKLYRKLYIAYSRMVKKLLLASSMTNMEEYSRKKRTIIKIASYFDPKKVLAHIERNSTRYAPENSDYYACYADLTNVYKAEDFRERVLMDFEGEHFWGPRNYDSLLKADFGDYMKLPPKEERIPHHISKIYYK